MEGKKKKAKTWQNEDLELGILFPDSMAYLLQHSLRFQKLNTGIQLHKMKT